MISPVRFTIKMADCLIEITASYPATMQLCRHYLAEGTREADIRIAVTEEDILAEQVRSARNMERMQEPVRHFSKPYLETLAVYRKIAEELLIYDTLLFHGSVVAVDGVGYLFTAKSGVGKSTHTGLWRDVMGERAVMVNDDKPLLRIAEDSVTAYGTPWDGKHHLSNNIAVPLKAVCILRRNESNRIERIDGIKAYPMLIQQCYHSDNIAHMDHILMLLDRLVEKITFYELYCNQEREAALIAYKGMQ